MANPIASGKPLAACRGFTYVGLLILIAIFGVVAAGTVSAGAVMQRRAQEMELLYIGSQFQAAFKSYYETTPVGQQPYPKNLEDLVKDGRSLVPRRHLRRIFVDPLTGEARWGTVKEPGGGIAGVYSLSDAKPIQIGNFPPEFAAFEGKTKFSERVFSFTPNTAGAALPVNGGGTQPLPPLPPPPPAGR